MFRRLERRVFAVTFFGVQTQGSYLTIVRVLTHVRDVTDRGSRDSCLSVRLSVMLTKFLLDF